MCELMAMCFETPVSADFSIREFAARGEENADGWGLGWYPDRSLAVVKEPVKWRESRYAGFLETYPRLQSPIFLAHVRHKTRGGEPTHADTHPFAREWGGRDYAFAHNGTLDDRVWSLPLGPSRPLGSTDSEYAFCHLLREIAERGDHLDGVEDWRWLYAKLAELNRLGKLNVLLSDGHRLFCYHDTGGWKGLNFRALRVRDHQTRHFEDASLAIDVEAESANHGFVVATQPLSAVGVAPLPDRRVDRLRAGEHPLLQPSQPPRLGVLAGTSGGPARPRDRARAHRGRSSGRARRRPRLRLRPGSRRIAPDRPSDPALIRSAGRPEVAGVEPAVIRRVRPCRNRTRPGRWQAPWLDLDEWESAWAPGDPEGSSTFRDYRENVRAGVREFYRLNHAHQTLDFVLEKKRQYLSRTRRVMGIWEAMEFLEHARRRQRPRHRPLADRAPDADGRGDPPRRPPALVHPDRADPRPGQGPLPLRRAAVGRRRRHVPGRLPLLRQGRLPRVLRGQPRLRRARVPDPAAASTPKAAGSTASTCRGGTTSTCTTSSRTTCPRRPWP